MAESLGSSRSSTASPNGPCSERGRAIPSRKHMFTLDQVVPWGRSFDEYQRMFALTEADLSLRIVGCGDGPASFNAEATRRGARSCPHRSHLPMRGRSDSGADRGNLRSKSSSRPEATPGSSSGTRFGRSRSSARFAWPRCRRFSKTTVWEGQRSIRRQRTADASLLTTRRSIWRSAHISLFLYTSQLGEAFHRSAIREMCRVAAEIRIFPLLALGGRRSPRSSIRAVVDDLRIRGVRRLD